jgi:hypothetical protein
MRFLIDENLSPVLADLARERGYKAIPVIARWCSQLPLLAHNDQTHRERVQMRTQSSGHFTRSQLEANRLQFVALSAI